MGIVGAGVFARWSWGQLRDTGLVLVDASANQALEEEIREAIEDGDAVITDLHVWQVGPGKFAAIISLVADRPVAASIYAARVQVHEELVHVTVEAHRCSGAHPRIRAVA
jgi:Co/Zn/Cd efflux system component